MREIFAPDLLEGRHILITGGGTGLGLSMSRRFLKLGARVTICGRRGEVLLGACSNLRAELGNAMIEHRVCDIRDAEAVEAMVASLNAVEPIDILVNNAAANFIAQTHRLSARAADAILATSLHGAMYCTLAAGRRWIEAERPGVVLSILSTSPLTGRAFTAPSAMAKAALLAMTKSLAVEWGPRGVRLCAIGPGSFPTEGATRQLNPALRVIGAAAPANPLGRNGDHEELANLAAFLISEAGAYINGEMVVIDGGGHLRTSGAEDLLSWSDARWDEHRSGLKGG